MEISFHGKVAFIAGASVGIGAAIAKTLATSGASVGLMARRPEPLHRLEAEIVEAGGKAIAVPGDVSNPEDLQKAIELTVKQFGGLHLAVNNAGISGDFGLLHDITIENWKNVMGVNLDGIFYGMKYQIPELLKSGGGAIVNIGSVEGSTILPQNVAYTSSKYAIHGLTKTSAYDYAKLGIRINTVSPGVIDTPLTQSKGDISGPMGKIVPMGRMGEPQEIADAVAYVLSDKASYMTGVDLLIDGAFLLRQPIGQ